MKNISVTVIGAGLAGSEAAWQLAQRDIHVELYEMRPLRETGAHISGNFAELICSNSLGSNLYDRSSGLLKNEIRLLKSKLMEVADKTAIPAGGALAVDRELFSAKVTYELENHPNIKIIREECIEIPDGPVIIASGPLTSAKLTAKIIELTNTENLYFFDAIAPIVQIESINFEIAFRASRYSDEDAEGDYINCPMDKDQYITFISELTKAKRIQLKSFEKQIETGVNAGDPLFFEGCLPVEILASRGEMAMAFGPLRPVGLKDPRSGKRPFAILQLRQDNLAGDLYNLVGFQTNLTFPEQRRVFRIIPGLENAEFARYGQMHRNTFIASPKLLKPSMQSNGRQNLFFAGQITGVEGYVGNIATGLLAGINLAKYLRHEPLLVLPQETMVGALCHYITHANQKDFQPMKANFGILPPLEMQIKTKRERYKAYADRSMQIMKSFLEKGLVE